MKAKFGMIVVDGAGKLGGQVIQKSKAGTSIRTRVKPTNKKTSAQQAVKADFTTHSQSWRGLTQVQISAWNAYAASQTRINRFGDGYTPSGKQLYQELNANCLMSGGVAITTPPSNVAVTSLTALSSGSLTAAAMTVTYAPTPVPAGYGLVISATAPLSPGVSASAGKFRTVQVIAAAGASPANVFAAYSAIFGAPVATKKVFVKAQLINKTTGQRAGSLQYSAIVA